MLNWQDYVAYVNEMLSDIVQFAHIDIKFLKKIKLIL